MPRPSNRSVAVSSLCRSQDSVSCGVASGAAGPRQPYLPAGAGSGRTPRGVRSPHASRQRGVLSVPRLRNSAAAMPKGWPAASYENWRDTCDTLHAHTQVLGKVAARLAPPEPQLQHAALRLTVRGWETSPLPAPDGSGSVVLALDLHVHQALVEHSDGRIERIALTPDRPVADVTRDVLTALNAVAGQVQIDPTPQEVPWSVPLDADYEHARYDVGQVADYFAAANRAALVLAAFRAPYRGRSTPVNAWWGSFDLAVSLFSGRSADPPSDNFIMRNAGTAQAVEVGWWPGDARYGKAAFYAYAYPVPEGFADHALAPAAARWDSALGEYILDWDDVRAEPDPAAVALEFARSAFRHACAVCGWDLQLAASADSRPPPVT